MVRTGTFPRTCPEFGVEIISARHGYKHAVNNLHAPALGAEDLIQHCAKTANREWARRVLYVMGVDPEGKE